MGYGSARNKLYAFHWPKVINLNRWRRQWVFLWAANTISHKTGGAGLCTVVCWLGKHFYEPPQPDQIESIQSHDMGKCLPHSNPLEMIRENYIQIIFKLLSIGLDRLFNQCIGMCPWKMDFAKVTWLAPTPNLTGQELYLGMKREISGCLPIDGTSKVLNYEFLEKMSYSQENWVELCNWLNLPWSRVAATEKQQQL